MSQFDKKIVYLDYIEEEEKVKNAGSGKIIFQGGRLCLSLNISGLYQTDTIKCELSLLQKDSDFVLDYIFFEKGRCTYSRIFQEKELYDKGILYEESIGIRIRITEKRYLQTIWKELEETAQENKEKQENKIKQQEDTLKPEEWEIEKVEMAKEETAKEEPKREDIEKDVIEKEDIEKDVIEKEQIRKEEREAFSQMVQAEVREVAKEMVEEKLSYQPVDAPTKPSNKESTMKERDYPPIQDDKWCQLEQIYPSIHPFANEKKYLSIEPKDFVVLTKEFQPLANNSFLLHGFYNYRHIILGKIERGELDTYYIGVPGVFYEREKMVAVMFGFESFESGKEPSEIGSFGYYMKKVEI